MVTAGKMRSFVGDNATGLLLVQSGGEIDAWVYNAKDKRRGNGVYWDKAIMLMMGTKMA